MNKKLIALAVAAAAAAPVAMAQTANPVTLYGRAYVMVESAKSAGGNAGSFDVGSRIRVADYSSLLGVRGTEDLGGGLKAFFQLETAFRLDSNDAGNGGATTFANRNSGVGLQGGFGSVVIGRWDTPFKTATVQIDPFGNLTAGDLVGIMSDRGNFNRRNQNVVQWWSPNWSGVQIRTMYAANERKTGGTGAAAGSVVNPSDTGMSITYTQGPIYVGYAWERHKDQFKAYTGAVADVIGGAETGQAFFANFTVGPLRVGLQTQKFDKKTGTAATVTDIKANQIALTYTAGKNQFVYSYLTSKDGLAPTAALQPKSTMNVLGYFYNFSRRTSFVAQYAKITNNAAGLSNLAGGVSGFSAGQDPQTISAGFRHTF